MGGPSHTHRPQVPIFVPLIRDIGRDASSSMPRSGERRVGEEAGKWWWCVLRECLAEEPAQLGIGRGLTLFTSSLELDFSY